MNRLERLVNLVAALLDADRPLARGEIYDRVPGYGQGESARRAFERDKDALRAMGIPLVTEPLHPDRRDPGDGYRIPPERYQLPDPGLAPDELGALHLAASTVRLGAARGPGAPPEAAVAIWKLGGATGGADPAAPLAALPGSEHLVPLFSALGERRRVAFRYRGEDRAVDPFRLSYAGGHWYLIGHDHLRGDTRRFRLDRMESPPRPGEAGGFQRPAGAPVTGPPAPWLMGDEDEVEALLLVDADQADRAVARTGPQAVRERRADGSVVLALAVTNREAFRSFALGFLDHAEVIGPQELRDDMLAWLDRLAAAAPGVPAP